MVKDNKYVELVKSLQEKQIFELVDEQPVKINGLFAVEKDVTRQRLILDARRANHYFSEPEDPRMPHPGLITQLL